MTSPLSPSSEGSHYNSTTPKPSMVHWTWDAVVLLILNNLSFSLHFILVLLMGVGTWFRCNMRLPRLLRPRGPELVIASPFIPSSLSLWPQYCCVTYANSLHLEHLKVKASLRGFLSTQENYTDIKVDRLCLLLERSWRGSLFELIDQVCSPTLSLIQALSTPQLKKLFVSSPCRCNSSLQSHSIRCQSWLGCSCNL